LHHHVAFFAHSHILVDGNNSPLPSYPPPPPPPLDPSDTHRQKDYEAEGRFTFNTHEAGEHTICLSSNTTSGWWGGELMRIYLDLRVGEQSVDYEKVAKKEQLTQVETRLYVSSSSLPDLLSSLSDVPRL
jgi:hypothetical protein